MNLRRVLSTTAALLGSGALIVSCSPAQENPAAGEPTRSQTSGAERAGTTDLIVLGAASTRVVNEELAELTPDHLEFINAGSSTLVQQLGEGSPGDLLLTADQASMDRAAEAGLVAAPVAFATNSMVMVVPAGNPAGITGVDDSLDGADLVLCDPQVPCGAVTERIISDQGHRVTAVSLEHSVSDTLGKVTSGEADAGWVYRTDAQAAGEAVEVIDIPGAAAVPNTLYAAVAIGSVHPVQAGVLLELITGPEMAAIWEEHGFTPTHE